jgi:hypothetical protein
MIFFNNPKKGVLDLSWYVSGKCEDGETFYLHRDGNIQKYCTSDDHPNTSGWFDTIADAYDAAREYCDKHHYAYPYTLLLNPAGEAVACCTLSGELLPNDNHKSEKLHRLEIIIEKQQDELKELKAKISSLEWILISALEATQKDINEIQTRMGM